MRNGLYKGVPTRGAKRDRRNRRATKTYHAIELALQNRWWVAGFLGHYDSRTWGKEPADAKKALGWK